MVQYFIEERNRGGAEKEMRMSEMGREGGKEKEDMN